MSDPIELKPIGASARGAGGGGLGSKSGKGSSGSGQPPLPPRHPAAHSGAGGASDSDAASGSGSGSLGRAYRLAEDKARAAVHLQEGGLDAVSVWGLALASWSALLAIPLLLFPRILLFFAQVPPSPSSSAFASAAAHEREEHYDLLTPLESFLCLTLGLGLLSLALISLFVLVPSYTAPSTNPSRMPLLGVLVGLETIVAIVTWNTASIGGLATALALGHTVVSTWGWWVVVFGMGGSRLSKQGSSTKGKTQSKVSQRFKKL